MFHLIFRARMTGKNILFQMTSFRWCCLFEWKRKLHFRSVEHFEPHFDFMRPFPFPHWLWLRGILFENVRSDVRGQTCEFLRAHRAEDLTQNFRDVMFNTELCNGRAFRLGSVASRVPFSAQNGCRAIKQHWGVDTKPFDKHPALVLVFEWGF